MIKREWGLQMVEALTDLETEVFARVAPAEIDLLSDTVSGFSSRGPGRWDGGLKPQITAPGSSIVSALATTGDEGAAFSGTSMAGPTVAGVAALLWERNRSQSLNLDGADIGALAMNYSQQVIKDWRNDDLGLMMPVARQGAGRTNAFKSASGMTLVRSAEGLAEIGAGMVHVTDDVVVSSHELTVRNMGTAGKSYSAEFHYAFPEEDADQGVTVAADPSTFTVAPGATQTVEVTITFDPEMLRPYDLDPVAPIFDEAPFQTLEVDGWVHIVETDGSQPKADGDTVSVPLHTLPFHDSCVSLDDGDAFSIANRGEVVELTWSNDCGADGEVGVYVEVGTDPQEQAFPGKIDVESVAVRAGPIAGEEAECSTFLEWAITTRESKRIPYDAEFRIFVDTDHDGELDRVIFNFYGPDLAGDLGAQFPEGVWWVGHAEMAVDELTGRRLPEPDLETFYEVIYAQPHRIDERVTRLPVCLPHLGVQQTAGRVAFDFAVSASDYTEDYPIDDDFLGYDLAPDGMEDGDRFSYDHDLVRCISVVDEDGRRITNPMSDLLVPGDGTATGYLTVGCGAPHVEGEVRIVSAALSNLPGSNPLNIRAGSISANTVWLPYTSNKHEFAPPAEPTAEPEDPTPMPTDEPIPPTSEPVP